MTWKVYMNGKDLGIVESNYEFASKYWIQRARLTGNFYQLKPQYHQQEQP